MIVQCPHCQARYQLEEKQFGGRAEVQLRCTKCHTLFTMKASAETTGPAAAAGSTPIHEATMVSRPRAGPQLPEGKTVSLSATDGPQKGKIFIVNKPRVVIGRSGTDIVVEDPEVSRKHCALEVHGVTALLADLGSANGTFVNEQKIETCKLEHLSEFRIGETTLLLTITDKA